MSLTDDDVSEILRIIDSTPLAELRIEVNGFKLHVVRDLEMGAAATPRVTASPPAAIAATELASIDAPMLGTFYRAQAPGEPPFVEVGSQVEPTTTVCIIEVMKMMNSVPAGVAGKVVEVVAGNGELVEYGAPLFRVAPL